MVTSMSVSLDCLSSEHISVSGVQKNLSLQLVEMYYVNSQCPLFKDSIDWLHIPWTIDRMS